MWYHCFFWLGKYRRRRGKLRDDDILNNIREDDEEEETLSDSEEIGETFKRLDDQAVMGSVKTYGAFLWK